MLRLTAFAFLLMPAAFLASPLTADDLYGAPDPGWYNAGSGWAPQSAPGSGYDASDGARPYARGGYGYDGGWAETTGEPGYGSGDWGTYQPSSPGSWYEPDTGAMDRYGYDQYRDPRQADQPRTPWSEYPQVAPEPVAPSDYGAPDWAQQRPSAGHDDDDRRPPSHYRSGGYVTGDETYRDARGPWRAPPSRPQYRFRDDPDLEQRVGGRNGTAHRFRPLTPKEQERHREATRDYRFVEPERDRRYRAREDEERGTAFGYAPGPPQPDDFYQRYYRSGP